MRIMPHLVLWVEEHYPVPIGLSPFKERLPQWSNPDPFSHVAENTGDSAARSLSSYNNLSGAAADLK